MMATVSGAIHCVPTVTSRRVARGQLHRSFLQARRRHSLSATEEQDGEAAVETQEETKKDVIPTVQTEANKGKRRSADSTDAVASFLTRRFGIGAGLAWLGILTIGTLGEQIKTRLEVRQEQQGSKDIQNAKTITLPSGVTYLDRKIGGGSRPYKGALVVVNLKGSLMDETKSIFEDSFSSGKQIAFAFGSRPLNAPLCPGLEEAMSSMKTGGTREITVPPEMGFGDDGTVWTNTKGEAVRIPSNATLHYLIELRRVSIAP